MTTQLKHTVIKVGLAGVIGLALALTITAHFFLDILSSSQELAMALLVTSGCIMVSLYWLMARLIWPAVMNYALHVKLVATILSFAISGLFMFIYWGKPRPISWFEETVGQSEWPPMILKTWGGQRLGFELHATVDNAPQWNWRTFINLQQITRLFGGKLLIWLTQPEWAVFDEQKQVYQGGDGVEVCFIIERNRNRETLQQVNLNLHAHPEQRRWKAMIVSVPAGSQYLSIEALPGPPGSNNWHDRVWISVEPVEGLITLIVKLADGFAISWLVFLLLAVMLLLPRAPHERGVNKGVLLITCTIAPVIFFIFLGETYLRMQGYKPYLRTYPGQYQNRPIGVAWAESDSLLGWTAIKADGEINPQGFRDTKVFDATDLHSGKTRVMILGDSFMYGAGVHADENVASFLQAKLQGEYEFYNLGVPGWGIDQMYLAYQKYKSIIDPHIVILAFIDDDVNRVLEAYRVWEGLNKPSFIVKHGELVPRTFPTPSQLLLNRVMSKSVFFSLIMHHVYRLQDAGGIVKYIFLKMAEETERQNGKLVVVRIPTIDNANSMTTFIGGLNNFGSLLKSNKAQYLEPLDDLRRFPQWTEKFYLKDGHMSAAGNQFLADYIRRQVFEKLS